MRRNSAVQLDMVHGPLAGKMLMFAIPLILTTMLQLLFNAADIIVVGQFSGEGAVAAVGSTSFLINLLINFFAGISIGATAYISAEIGRNKLEGVSRAAHTSVMIGLIFGIAVGLIGVFGAEIFLRWMSTPADVLDQATLYLRIYFAGTPFFMVYTFARAVFITSGDTKSPLIYLTIAGAVNVIINLILVIVFDMGVAGVAIGTVASQFVSVVLMLGKMSVTEGPLGLDLKKIRIDKPALAKILYLGIPAGLQTLVFSVSNVMIQSSVNSLGMLYVAGNSAASNVEGFVWTSMEAFNQTAMTFMGQNYGAGKYERFNKIYFISSGFCFLVGVGLGLIVLVFRVPILSFYLPTSEQAVYYGSLRLFIFMTTYWTCGLMNVAAGCARGLEHPLFPMIVSMVGVCGLRVFWIIKGFPWSIERFGTEIGYQTLVATYPVSWVITGSVLIVYYFYVRKKIMVSHSAEQIPKQGDIS
ncbi:MAG: MATE family efflux transporter [Lachnospiraceae bacterium]|nr:MATE family efflux transporter [Lachnospiraceae bacterium]